MRMSWVKVDDKIFLNGKFRLATDAARLLYFSGLCFSAQAETDGAILASDLPVVAAYARIADASAIAKELVQLRLWELADGGHQIHDYLEYQPSRSNLEAERKRKREWAAANSGATSASSGQSNSATVAASRSRSRSRSGSRTQPDPKSDPEVGAEAPADGHSPPAAAGVSLLDFCTRGKVRTWSLTQPEADRLAEAFPELDIIAVARKAKAWIAANPTKTKTAKGMSAFLYSWVAREQDGRPGRATTAPSRDPRVGRAAAEDFDHSGPVGPVNL
jgi:hypothetical protein